MRLVVALRRLAGVFRGRYEWLFMSADARDRRRRVCWRSRDTKLDNESKDGCVLCAESTDSVGDVDLCMFWGWTYWSFRAGRSVGDVESEWILSGSKTEKSGKLLSGIFSSPGNDESCHGLVN